MTQPEAAGGVSRRIIHRTDTVVAAILIGGALLLWRTSNNFEEAPALFSQNISADMFPKILLVCIIGLSLILPFEHLFLSGGRQRLDGGRRTAVQPRAYMAMALIAVILAAMPFTGTIITMFAISLLVPLLWGERRLTRLLPFAIIFPSAVVLLFGFLLKVHLESGQYGIGLY